MRILIVEDEKKTAAYLQKGLTENAYICDVAADGEAGWHLASEQRYDFIILDVMLPHLDGWQVLEKIRQRDKQTPILFLTARNEVADRVKGLELGADDYLVKPFAFSELLARLQALSRRAPIRQDKQLAICDLEIDFMQQKAARAGTRLDLTQKEFSLLSLLARNQGKLMSRTLIAEKVWDMNFDSQTNVVDVAIRRLRRKVDDGFSHKLIHTVRGVGYVLESR